MVNIDRARLLLSMWCYGDRIAVDESADTATITMTTRDFIARANDWQNRNYLPPTSRLRSLLERRYLQKQMELHQREPLRIESLLRNGSRSVRDMSDDDLANALGADATHSDMQLIVEVAENTKGFAAFMNGMFLNRGHYALLTTMASNADLADAANAGLKEVRGFKSNK